MGRNHFSQRLALTGSGREELQARLAAVAAGPGSGCGYGAAQLDQSRPRVAFLFTGQGSQYVGMGRELYESEPIFRAVLDRCEALYQEYTGESLLAVIYPELAAMARPSVSETKG